MRLSSLPAAALGVLFGLTTGCTDAVQPEPPPSAPPVVEPPAPPSPILRAFPELSRPGVIYEGGDDVYRPYSEYHEGTLVSRYVLYQDGFFGLQFLSPKFGYYEFPGRYSRAGSRITLGFADANTAGPWQATATLSGDSLAVEYNLVMNLADFLDGVYVWSPEAR